MLYLSSDFHFNHTNICGPSLTAWPSGYRSFASLQAMNSEILSRTNASVRQEDELWFLGDFAFGNKNLIPALFESIQCGDIKILFGNHDDWIKKNFHLLPGKVKLLGNGEKHFESFKDIDINFSHYPSETWEGQHLGAGLVHGHSHGNLACGQSARILDVGVDTKGFAPYTIDEVTDWLLKQPIQKPKIIGDHH